MLTFSATAIPGSGRGKALGMPTVNLDLEAVPAELEEGIYACMARINDNTLPHEAVMHYGKRPVFKDTPSCEIHFLDTDLQSDPQSVSVTVVEKIRDVQDFASAEELKAQMNKDCDAARAILQRRATSNQG